MNICVFCSAEELVEVYVGPARELARRIAEGGHGLVWGGSNTGLMKVVADEVQEGGGRLIGISMELLRDRARPNADEMVVTKNLGERKAMMLERADAFVVMTGGIGTLDEIMSVLELRKHGVHHKPTVLLNIADFYEGLKLQLSRMSKDGFIQGRLEELTYFTDTPEEAMRYIESHVS